MWCNIQGVNVLFLVSFSIQNFTKKKGFGINFFELSSCAWTTCYAYYFYRANTSLSVKLFVKFCCISILLPLILSLVPLFDNAYGFAGTNDESVAPWCWIRSGYWYYRLFLLYILLLCG